MLRKDNKEKERRGSEVERMHKGREMCQLIQGNRAWEGGKEIKLNSEKREINVREGR